MTEDNADHEFYTDNHHRLIRIATIANICVWIVLIISILLTASQILTVFGFYIAVSTGPSFLDMLKHDPSTTVRLLLEAMRTLVQGVVFALVAKAISLGLEMIVETDLNYRAAEENSHD